MALINIFIFCAAVNWKKRNGKNFWIWKKTLVISLKLIIIDLSSSFNINFVFSKVVCWFENENSINLNGFDILILLNIIIFFKFIKTVQQDLNNISNLWKDWSITKIVRSSESGDLRQVILNWPIKWPISESSDN